MIQHIDAIYDNGVLRPVLPLALPDQSRVKLTVEAEPVPLDVDKLARQKAALESLWQELDKRPRQANNDGWSVRRHDELLYGKQ